MAETMQWRNKEIRRLPNLFYDYTILSVNGTFFFCWLNSYFI